VLDTPGFGGKEEEYLQAKFVEIDTLLYCVSMTESRITDATKEQLSSTVSKLEKVLSKEIWKNCVVALTFANSALSRIKEDPEIENDDVEIMKEFNSILDEWKSEVRSVFSAANIDNYEKIPIVAAGSAKKRKLLPDDDKPWLSTLWHTIYDASPADGRAVLFHFNAQRLTDGDISSVESFSDELHQQKIKVDGSFTKKLWETIKGKYTTIAVALGVGGAGGIAGATIGATIGALAIGIPTFGMAAGIGLVLGGLIGGTGVGAAAGVIIECVQSERKPITGMEEKKKLYCRSSERM
jgi:hypothetical protein